MSCRGSSVPQISWSHSKLDYPDIIFFVFYYVTNKNILVKIDLLSQI